MNNQENLYKEIVAEIIINESKKVLNSFTNEDFELMIIKKIVSLDSGDIACIALVSKSMASKYKSGESLPPLDKAILLENHFGIPPRCWMKLREVKK